MAGSYTPPKLTDTPLPDLFTLVAQQNPQRPFVQIIREHAGSPTDCVRFTWAEVIQHAQDVAADLRCRWAERRKKEDIKKPREPGTPPVVVGVLAKNGYELYVNILGCLFNRWTVLLISPRNSPAAVEHLLQTSKSVLFLVDSSNLGFGYAMEKAIPDLTAQAVADLEQSTTGSASPLTSLTREQSMKEKDLPAFYLHTSGSTGHPKIIPWSHEFVLSGARSRQRDDNHDYIGRPYYCMVPLIHSMGIIAHVMFTLAHGHLITFVSSPTPKPPSASSLLAHLPFIKGGLVMLAPSILEELYSLGPEAVKDVAKGTRFIIFGGAALNVSTGNALVATGLNLSGGWGTTEIGVGCKQEATKKPEDWEYMYFCETYEWHFLPIDDHSNVRELVVGPGPDGSPIVINHEDPIGYATNDLWEPHPTIPKLWKHRGRKGDVTVLSNGEKTDNKQIENILLGDKRIRYVQVFGAGRQMNGVILQPAESSVQASEFLIQITPTIEHANSILPAHSRLIPELIVIAASDKPFATTDKGTVKGRETLDRFQQEIERAYDTLEEGGSEMSWKFEGDARREHDVKVYMRKAVQEVLMEEVPDDADLFEHGMDSLLSAQLRMAVLSVVEKSPTASQPVPRNITYTSPSINALTTYLLSRVKPGAFNKSEADERIRQSIIKYSSNFIPHTGSGSGMAQGKVIALSGSTGSAGSSMLGILLGREDVGKIYLLNRRGHESQYARHAKSLKERGLDPQLLDTGKEKIVYLDVDFSKNSLGLSVKDFEELRDNVTHIIHSAWHLNFNLILESYERVHIAGVRHLIDLALSSPHAHPPRLIFLSSIAAASRYQGPTREPSVGERGGQVLVPEEPIDDPSIVLDQGYGQSKYVSERVLVNAVGAGLRATIIRVGQLSGATTTGAWATSEHVPIMLRSSVTMGVFPMDLPSVRWMPSDIAASAIIKQAFHDSAPPLEYLSIENPFLTPWNLVAQGLVTASPKPLRPVTLAEWLEHIKTSHMDSKDVDATKLLEFFEDLARGARQPVALGWQNSVQLVPELAEVTITGELVKKYAKYQLERAGDISGDGTSDI